MFYTYLGTDSGVYRLEGQRLTSLGLAEHTFWTIHALRAPHDRRPENDTILAGSYGQGLFRSTDGGATWLPANQGLTATALRTLIADPAQNDALLCGSEPGRGFRSTDRGQNWSEMTSIAALPNSTEWYLPYSPRAGALRNFYVPPGRPKQLFASIEVGGLLGSTDGGETWAILGTPDDDIHHITGHPDRPDELWMALGWAGLKHRSAEERSQFGGVARSEDGGHTWTKLIERDYTRAVIVPPAWPNLVLAAPAKAVGRQGRIVISSDGGQSWEEAGHGIEKPMTDMVELFVAAPDGSIWAICAEGRLLRAEAGEWRWREALASADAATIRVRSVSFVLAG